MIEKVEKGFQVDSATLDFLVYALLGKSYREVLEMAGEGMDGVLDLCARRAYRDLSRTLRFCAADDKVGRKEVEAKKKELLKKAREVVVSGSKDLLRAGSQDDFDRLHEKICGEEAYVDSRRSIVETVRETPGSDVLKPVGKEGEIFYSGQAQKWLNMTLKYFWVLGFPQFEDGPCNAKGYLHAPIDGFVLAALKRDEALSALMQAGDLGNGIDANKVHECVRVPWSHWSYENYKTIQMVVRSLSESSSRCPIEWEMDAWLTAVKR